MNYFWIHAVVRKLGRDPVTQIRESLSSLPLREENSQPRKREILAQSVSAVTFHNSKSGEAWQRVLGVLAAGCARALLRACGRVTPLNDWFLSSLVTRRRALVGIFSRFSVVWRCQHPILKTGGVKNSRSTGCFSFLLLEREWAGLETSKPSNPFQAETRGLSANQTRRQWAKPKRLCASSAWERSAQTDVPQSRVRIMRGSGGSWHP